MQNTSPHDIIDISSAQGLAFVRINLNGSVFDILSRDVTAGESRSISNVINFLVEHKPTSSKMESVRVGNAVKYSLPTNARAGIASLVHNVCKGNMTEKKAILPDAVTFDRKVLELSGLQSSEVSMQVAYLHSLKTDPQEWHFDYNTDKMINRLRNEEETPKIALLPLTNEGSYIEVVPTDQDEVLHENQWKATFMPEVQTRKAPMGTILFIPFGKMLFLPGETIHSGGFRTQESTAGHLRLHMYVLPFIGDQPLGNQTTALPENQGAVLESLIKHKLSEDEIRESHLFTSESVPYA